MNLDPQLTLTANWIAFILYGLGAIVLIVNFLKQKPIAVQALAGYTAITLVIHGLGIHGMSLTPNGFYLSFFGVASLIFWLINTIVFLSSFKKPLHNLFILLYPFTVLCLASTLLSRTESEPQLLPYSIASHVILSILAYSLLMIASLQAVILAYQNHKLRHKLLGKQQSLLPPLMTMESLLFEFIWVGVICLTFAIISGFWFLDDMFAQHLAHKTIFSIIAWFIYTTLLVGRVSQGWRGYKAIRWTLVGFLFLMLAYFGSRFVLELLLT